MATRLVFATFHLSLLPRSSVVLAAGAANHDLVGTPLVVLVLVVAAILTFTLNPRDGLIRIFALLLLTAALIVGVDPLFERREIWGRAIEAAANGLGVSLFLRFCLTYPNRQPGTVPDGSCQLRAMYTIGPRVPLVAALIDIALLRTTGWLAGVGTISICLGILFGLMGGLVMLGRTFLRNAAPVVRGPILVVWLGAALTFIPLMGLNVVPALFFHPSLIPFSATSYTLLFLPLSVGFATIRWGPFSLTTFIDRVSVYVALGALLLACYAGLALLVTTWEGVPFSPVAAITSLALAILAAGTFAPARAAIERVVDSLVYRDHYDLGATVQRFSHSLAAIHDQAGVVDSLLDDLCETLNLSGAAFVPLPGGFSRDVLRVLQPDDLEARREYASPQAREALLHSLAELQSTSAWGSNQLPVMLNPWPGCAALVLIRGGSGEALSALLLIGLKRSGCPLRAKDRTVLATIAHQASTALENAVLIGGLHTTMAQLKRSAEQLEAARIEQRLLLREVVDANERQRAALARDLHDDALQDLLYVSRHSRYCAGLMELAQAPDESAATHARRLRDELSQLAQAADGAERKLRDLCAGLYPALLESLGLVAALETLADDLGTAEGTVVTFWCDDGAEHLAARLDGDIQLHAYRIAQEAARNAARHAHGQRIEIRLALAPDTRRGRAGAASHAGSRLLLSVRDDGQCMPLPVDYTALLRAGHLGLASIRERATRIGADLTLNRHQEGGLCVRAVIPTPPHASARRGAASTLESVPAAGGHSRVRVYPSS